MGKQMTDDLVKRLRRDLASRFSAIIDNAEAAADRIEELEAALRLIADTDPAGDQHWPGRIARFVLDGKTND
jgi:plasmid stabilization system protein ParE